LTRYACKRWDLPMDVQSMLNLKIENDLQHWISCIHCLLCLAALDASRLAGKIPLYFPPWKDGLWWDRRFRLVQ
jgi:hypothetical protein